MRFIRSITAGALFVIGAASCSATPEESTPGVQTKALYPGCVSDADCVYAPYGSTIDVGEHCGLDGECHTFAEDPTCGLWAGTYPDCSYYPDNCRISHCAQPAAECDGYFCVLQSPP